MKPRLSIATCDIVQREDPVESLWAELLRDHYEIVAAPVETADVTFYCDWGQEHWRARGRKIYFTGENMEPDYNECDFALTSNHRENDPKHFRWPYYAQILPDPTTLIKPANYDPAAILAAKKKFCCFIASNPRAPERNRFFKMLRRHKPVDSGGRHFNTLGYVVKDKLAFAGDYKFIVAFENSRWPGYTTEKIVDAMLAGGLPIYWGNPEVGRDFNPRSFVNANDFPNLEALVEHLIELDRDDARYLEHLRQPWFNNNTPPPPTDRALLQRALLDFIQSGVGPGPRRYRKRRLREHAYSSPLAQTLVSARCRLEGALWKLGFR
jgi:hypothetical protein